MIRSFHFWKQLAIAAFFLAILDGCIYRDPEVQLPHGYEIGSASGSSPCMLSYWRYDDDRSYSDWLASEYHDDEGVLPRFRLYRVSELILAPGEKDIIDFEDEAAWRADIAEKRAQPDYIAPYLEDVAEFTNDDEHAIGKFGEGFFIVEFAGNTVETFESEAQWQQAVAKRTQLAGAWLWNPKSPLIQTRHGWMLLFYAAIMAFAIYKGLQGPEQRAA